MPFAVRPRRNAALLAGVVSAAGACAVAQDVPSRPARDEATFVLGAMMPRPDRGRMHEAVRLNDQCVDCHRDVAEEWRGSLHQRANVEPAYQRSFAIEPLAFCRSCHAPEAIATEEAPDAVSHLGVGCVTCHVTESTDVLAAPSSSGKPSPHGVRRIAAFAGPDACKDCHEFSFPMVRGTSRELLMQSTHTEHAESPGSARSCASCHMPINE